MFKKSIVVGVSVTPEVGLEVAQIDFASQTVLKYGVRSLEYDVNRREIADLDMFKEALQDLLFELRIPKGSELVLNFPSVAFRITDYPAALNEMQISNAIEEELVEHPIFQSAEPVVSATNLPNSSMQFYKIAYAALQKQMLIEVVYTIKELGYKVLAIDTSVSSVFNALLYKQRVDVSPGTNWVLLIVDNMSCRILNMLGDVYVDSMEEKISIGKVLDDEENYSTVLSAVNTLLQNMPAKYLCVVSKTNIISAEELASRISYSAPIIHQEANNFLKESLLDFSSEVDERYKQYLSLDVIGAALYREMSYNTSVTFNLFNASLGELFTSEQPVTVRFMGRDIVLSNGSLFSIFLILALAIVGVSGAYLFNLNSIINSKNAKLDELDMQAKQIQTFLKENENVSSELFDEGDEIRLGLLRNKDIYSHYTIVGKDIPQKLWLTHMNLSNTATIEGQAANLESVYAFFRGIKDYVPSSNLKLEKLGLATKAKPTTINVEEIIDEEAAVDDSAKAILTSINADFYEFSITNDPNFGKKKKSGKSNNAQDDLSGLESLE